jgi:pSer/pThr/pTyr-binding forkhead associated (FHA) protein
MRLDAVSGPHAGRVVDLLGELTVGRGPGCTLVLNDPKVSRRHATLTGEGRTVFVRDEGSLNGTWLNDERIAQPRRLAVGDRLRIGGSEFVVSDADRLGRQDGVLTEAVGS